MHAQVMDP